MAHSGPSLAHLQRTQTSFEQPQCGQLLDQVCDHAAECRCARDRNMRQDVALRQRRMQASTLGRRKRACFSSNGLPLRASLDRPAGVCIPHGQSLTPEARDQRPEILARPFQPRDPKKWFRGTGDEVQLQRYPLRPSRLRRTRWPTGESAKTLVSCFAPRPAPSISSWPSVFLHHCIVTLRGLSQDVCVLLRQGTPWPHRRQPTGHWSGILKSTPGTERSRPRRLLGLICHPFRHHV